MVQQTLDKPKVKLTWLFKKCDRCNGDLYYDTDLSGEPYYACLQCGSIKPFDKVISRSKSNMKEQICKRIETCSDFFTNCKVCNEIKLDDIRAKRIKWSCAKNALPEWHYEKDDEVIIVEDFLFYKKHSLSHRLETLFVPTGTIGYITNTWRTESDGKVFVDLLTSNGVKLQGIPYNAIDWNEETADETIKESN